MRNAVMWLAAFVLAVSADTRGSDTDPPARKVVTNSIGMSFVRIETGEFLMGSPESEKDRDHNEEQHRVRITKPFYLGAHEVRVRDFRRFVAHSGYMTDADKSEEGGHPFYVLGAFVDPNQKYTWRNPGYQDEDHPVVNVSWNDAVAFCAWLSKKEGRTYRLPTEAEWEYACRAGTETPFAFGETLSSKTDANADGRLSFGDKQEAGPRLDVTAPVGSYRANAWGLYDMHGNVYEWCSDWYDEGYYVKSPQDDPSGPASGELRVTRGGSMFGRRSWCRSACRSFQAPVQIGTNFGFRVVLVLAE